MTINPLVSIVVITYNSSTTVLETLDSIAAQTYNNIELIITDDCSSDNTIERVKSWLILHNERFTRSKLIVSETNTGSVKNINRGIKASKGEWIKAIAGDDILNINCIQAFVDYIRCNKDCKMCCCDLELFTTDDIDLTRTKERYSEYFNCVKEPQCKQWKRVKSDLTFPGPGYFYSRELYNEVGGFDENYVFLEETPFVFNVLKRGYRIYPVEQKLVQYRVSPNSVCRGQYTRTYKILLNDKYRFFRKNQLPALFKSGYVLTAIKYFVDYYKIDKEINTGIDSIQTKFAKLLYLFSPLHYIDFIRKRVKE